MAHGIHVFGAASMGALRAAELAPFGMIGVGEVFEAFRSGDLSDDDEVAVAHATAEFEYRPLSDAMVSLRASFRAAAAAGVITEATAARLERIAKQMPYADRRKETVLRAAAESGADGDQLRALREWFPNHGVDQKRRDALAMLERMAARARSGWIPMTVDYVFARTDAFETLERSVRREALAASSAKAAAGVLAEPMRNGGTAEAVRDAGLVRALCLEVARLLHIEIDARAVEAVIEDFRRERDLLTPEAFAGWIEKENLSDADLVAYFRREATVRRVKAGLGVNLEEHVRDHARTVQASANFDNHQ
jgi:hypothetical protein